MRIVKFLLARFDVDVSVAQFAEIDFRAGNGDAGDSALHRHVAEDEGGEAFGGEAVDEVHGDAVTMSVDELFIDPIAAALGELVYV